MEIPRTFILTVNRSIPCFDNTAAHLDSLGLKWERFNGMDNQLCRLNPVDTFDFDRVGERIGPKHIAATLSHYMMWKVMSYAPEDVFWCLEYDVEFMPDWENQYREAMSVLPDDWDVLFLGSCCCTGRETRHIAKNLYEVKYPLCGHAIMYHKKAFPVLLQEHQKICAPLDIALMHQSFPKLKVFTILPSIIGQHSTPLPP
jgi:GR25 family glycosyltransferase involved in LPS biosynthesis